MLVPSTKGYKSEMASMLLHNRKEFLCRTMHGPRPNRLVPTYNITVRADTNYTLPYIGKNTRAFPRTFYVDIN